ncbi:DUF5799 family protein [Halostagnicola kamekurae]|uniref:Uncharacterized protein n=1 Tax=Halostagnicola kamekurae TaxID=619731 RepID=A0A1I6S2I1_9EURY|nr:DUF5799 family protein [Halostagnicola kamekurae]SFS70958.1 hypothetical protein SAMN04488556_2376 [Halostagnicola kamekurae]
MSDNAWTDRIVGERMSLDQEFSSRVQNSRFSSQEWNLIMTATEFEIERPETPDDARIVADTENVESILPELENVRSQMGAMGAGGQGGADGSSGGGVVDSIKSALGVGGGSSGGSYDAEREAAETLTQEYADQLQSRLESNNRWQSVCEAAAEN